MGGLSLSPSVESSDGRSLILPGRTQLAGNAGKSLMVNAGETGYELGTAGGGGGPMLSSVAIAKNAGAPTRNSGYSTVLATGWDVWAAYTSATQHPGLAPSGTNLTLTPGWWLLRMQLNVRFPSTGAPTHVRLETTIQDAPSQSEFWRAQLPLYAGVVGLNGGSSAEVVANYGGHYGPLLVESATSYNTIYPGFRFPGTTATPSSVEWLIWATEL